MNMASFIPLIVFLWSFHKYSEAKVQLLKNYNGGQCHSAERGTFRIALQYCDGSEWLNMRPGKRGLSQAGKVLGKNCYDIKDRGLSRGDGEYLIDPDGGNADNAFRVFCDMTSFGGGWTMCYTTDSHVNIKTEISSKFAYGFDGYRTNCNNIPFTEVMFVEEKTKRKAAFAKTGPAITFAGNYDKRANAYGLWKPHGVASAAYKYQLLICDTSFYKGLHVSGYTKCSKHCDSWCSDGSSSYFRTAAVTNQHFKGVAFNQNGHRPRPKRLISAGIR